MRERVHDFAEQRPDNQGADPLTVTDIRVVRQIIEEELILP